MECFVLAVAFLIIFYAYMWLTGPRVWNKNTKNRHAKLLDGFDERIKEFEKNTEKENRSVWRYKVKYGPFDVTEEIEKNLRDRGYPEYTEQDVKDNEIWDRMAESGLETWARERKIEEKMGFKK